MIEIKDITKRYGERVLFENFSLEVEQGEFVVINGSSGAGKTTILNMIGGLEPFDSGSIMIDGLDVSKKKDLLRIFREKTGFIFQNFALVEKKTVYENLEMIHPAYRTEIGMEEALDMVGMTGMGERKVYSLSGGEQQRVAIARLFLKKATVILADEPTGSLDKENADMVMQLILELNKQNKTIIMVTHDEQYKKYGRKTIQI
ncbi:MAG: ABC transporter ATP-binding protein [Firmicutes bacterium]|nr:ABC transporter ATP-binding protein [Bacillota bacterium]